MSAGIVHLHHITHPSSTGEVQHCFPTELPLAQSSAGNKPTLSSYALPTEMDIAALTGCFMPKVP